MYCIPQIYICPKCGHKEEFSPSWGAYFPTTSSGEPGCKACWDEFLRDNIGIMKREKLNHPTTNKDSTHVK